MRKTYTNNLNTLFIIVLTILYSCGSEKSEQEILDDLGDRVERETRQNFDRFLASRQEETLQSLTLQDNVSDDFTANVCQEGWVKENFNESTFSKWEKELKNDCVPGNLLTKTFPTLISSHQLKTILWHFDKDSKVQDFSVIANVGLDVRRELVQARDNKKLSLVSFKLKSNDRLNLYIRTPSLQNSPMVYGEIIKLAISNNMNVMIEEVRGSRNSEGVFRWFDRNSIKDAEDIIKWIKKDNSKPIVAFGQGYDAMMSLAVGMGKESVQSIISCSAPVGLDDKGYSYDKLKFVWESEAGQTFPRMFEKASLVRSQGLGKEQIDLQLFGREVADYRDYLESDSQYNQLRDLDSRLRGVKYPVVHVAGLNNDPTLPGIFKKYKRLTSNNRHAFYFHKDGVGCGDLFTSRNFTNYLTGRRRPHISRYFQSLGRQRTVGTLTQHLRTVEIPVEFNESRFLLSHPSLVVQNGTRNLSAFSLNDYSTHAPGVIKQDKRLYINGPIEFKTPIKLQGQVQGERELILSLGEDDKTSTVVAYGLLMTSENEQKLTGVTSLLESLNVNDSLQVKLQSKPSTNISIPLIFNQGPLESLVTIPFKQSGEGAKIIATVEAF